MGESGSNYSTYDNHLSMYYSSRRDSTPTVVTIDTEIEQIFLEEALTHSPAEEMTNVNSNTTIAGPLIPRPVSSNVWTEFRENVSPDVDSDDEDEPQFKRQCEKPLNGEDQGDKEDREPNQCWCSKLSIVDQNLAKQMASLVLNDRISLILNDQTSRASNDQSSPASYYPAFLSLNGSALDASNMESTTARTFNSIAVQTDETPVEDKEDVPISKVSKPFGARWSRSFALNSSGPVYLGPWYDYLWRRRFAEPIEKKSPRKRHFSPRRKVDLPLPDRVSPIRVTLAMPVTAGGTQFVRKEALPVEISESGTAPDTRMPEQTSTASLLPQDRPKSWGDWWLVILAAVLIIYLWHLGRHKPIDASWIEVNDVPHGVLEKLRDNQVSEFRFPEMVEYEVGQWIQLDRVAHG
ncbi:hypothetical protein BDV59DRAFT_96355 [Aspergillus ambiguus]|uniref:uncharacterized protein n=1 Tax=Aspergillus ambiguus TaxID=176160 RepID=UPI003CCD5BE1